MLAVSDKGSCNDGSVDGSIDGSIDRARGRGRGRTRARVRDYLGLSLGCRRRVLPLAPLALRCDDSIARVRGYSEGIESGVEEKDALWDSITVAYNK